MKLNWQRVITFLCAIWPGGGYMYYGMMRKGAAVMALFTALLGLTLTVGWKFLAFLLPVIWCYCFFDTFHVAQLAVQDREREDKAFFETIADFLRQDPLRRLEDKRTYVGVFILLIALYTIVYGVLLPFFRWGEQFRVVRMLLSAIPTAVVAVLLFMVGKHMLQKEQERKEKQQFFAEEDWTEADRAPEETDWEMLVREPIQSENISTHAQQEMTLAAEDTDAPDEAAPQDAQMDASMEEMTEITEESAEDAIAETESTAEPPMEAESPAAQKKRIPFRKKHRK